MNSASSTLPTLWSVFRNDLAVQRAIKVCGFALMVALGFWWVGRPMPNADPSVDLSFETAMAARVPPVALGVATLALLVALWRYFRVRRVFTGGTVVRGTVEALETRTWQSSANVDQTHGLKSRTLRSYYATIRYSTHGSQRTARLKLAHSGSAYGLKRAEAVDLMVLDSMPEKPLIRAVYLPPP